MKAFYMKPPMHGRGINRQAGSSLDLGLVELWPHWDGKRSSRLTGMSLSRSHGTLTDMDPATDWALSPSGYALDYDGINDIVFAPMSAVSGYPFTLMILASVPVDAALFVMSINESGAGGRQSGLAFYGDSSNNPVVAASRYDSNLRTASTIGPGQGFIVGQLHMLVGVFESATSRIIYVDGGWPVSNATSVAAPAVDRIALGGLGDSSPSFGACRTVYGALWDRAIAAIEVKRLYHHLLALTQMPRDMPMWVGATSGGAPPAVTVPPLEYHYRRMRCA